jgi:hypothetical protein
MIIQLLFEDICRCALNFIRICDTRVYINRLCCCQCYSPLPITSMVSLCVDHQTRFIENKISVEAIYQLHSFIIFLRSAITSLWLVFVSKLIVLRGQRLHLPKSVLFDICE